MRVRGVQHSTDEVDQTFRSFAILPAEANGLFSRASTYPPHVHLFCQGEPSEEVYFLEHGLVKLGRLQPDGREAIVGLRGSGWLLGAAAAILHAPYAATSATVTACRIRRIKTPDFEVMLRTDPAFSRRVHEMHSREVYSQLGQVADFRSLSARERLEGFLGQLQVAMKGPNGRGEVRLGIPLKHWEVAQLLGITPQYLCQLLGEMEEEGVLRREPDGFVLLAPLYESLGETAAKPAGR